VQAGFDVCTPPRSAISKVFDWQHVEDFISKLGVSLLSLS